MNTDPSTPGNDANLSALGREMLATGGSKPSGPWVPPTAEELGKLLPEYDIVKMLGRGGMGAVYMGRQISLDRPVAIKILSNTLDEADASFAERFKNEARAMGKLNHPGIVAVHDFGQTAGGLLYIVMEYVEGTDVARMIAKEGRLHTDHAMAITAHVCDALAYAHDRGIIHRDIKPANIMVGYDGVVKVADFGLAKMTHSNASGLTQSGMAMGTLHYMAPEALMLGSAVDHRADIYAVGVMLYQMLTGKIPQGMFKLPSLQIPGLDPRYDAIIAKGIMEDREARYQSVGEMRRDLDGILTQPVVKVEPEVSQAPAALPTQARPQRPGGQPYRPPQSVAHHQPAAKSSSAWLVWAVLGLLAAGGSYFALNPASQKNRPSPDQTTPPQTNANSTTTPEQATKDAPFVNSLGMKFVPVPGTNVLFCIHETRRQDYASYAAEVKGVDGAWKNVTEGGIPCGDKDDHPVVGASWEDAQAFCAWLSKKEEKTYRLPTDREWSQAVGIAARETWAPDITPEMMSMKVPEEYPWGGSWPPTVQDRSGNYADVTRHEKLPKGTWIAGYEDGFATTAPVMSFKPNRWGLFDMGGNVWEMVDDWYDATKTDRVTRGASFVNDNSGGLLSSYRRRTQVGKHVWHDGFRCVLELTSLKAAAPSAKPSVAAPPSPATSMPAPVAPDKPQRIDGLVADGQWHDLLTKVAVTVKYRRGDWTFADKTLTANAPLGRGWSTIALPSQTLDGYQARLRFSSSGFGPIGFSLPSPSGSFSFGVSNYAKIVGPFGPPADSQNQPLSVPVADGQEHELLVEVSTDRLAASIDGKPVYAWENPPWTSIITPSDLASAHKQDVVIGISAGAGTVRFHSLELRIPPASGPLPPEAATRVANYQKAHHTQLAELTTKYRAALTTEKAAATKSGVLAAVTACDAAIANAAAFAQIIEANLTATEVKPLPVLAAVADPAPPRLKELRDIFVREVMKIETSLVAGLDQSLATVQASLVKAAQVDAAKAVENCRQQMMAAFKTIQPAPAVAVAVSSPATPASLLQATKGKPFVNSLGMKFVPVPGTKVLMCIHETRYRDYAAHATDSQAGHGAWKDQNLEGVAIAERSEEHPVVNVDWNDAQRFCSWLNGKEPGLTYRLPTDLEWSFGVGLDRFKHDDGTTPAMRYRKDPSVYPWDGGFPPRNSDKAGNYADAAWQEKHPEKPGIDGYTDGYPTTAPVMSFQPNKLGLYDMGGNVWEWCGDWFDDAQTERVLRGASWDYPDERILLSSYRARNVPRARFHNRGFRIVLELP